MTKIRLIRHFLLCLSLLLTRICFCQTVDTKTISDAQHETKQNNFGIEVIASILPPAKITREEGKYVLKSHLQSSYDLGINYLHHLKNDLIFSTGFHFIIGKRNFFANIPSTDINFWDGGISIEEKELWGGFRIPFLLEKKLNAKKTNPLYIKAGVTLRYSGLMSDESYGLVAIDSNYRSNDVFNADISARNNGIPWITFLAGLSKSILLNNKNVFSIGLQADISTTYFLKSNYEITIPNKPVTSGTYKINGSSVGLSVQYVFTGANKQIVKSKKVNAIRDTSAIIRITKENILSIGVQADISTTYFLKTNYEITIPNKPVTSGTYKISGSSIGLSVQYIFTGANKQIVKSKKVNAIRDTSSIIRITKENVLEKYIFKSNHIQFNFALLSTFKAQLTKISGEHPVSSSAAAGLQLSFKYQINFNDKYSLITGTEANLLGRNFNTSFSKNDFSPPLVSDYDTKGSSTIQDLVLSLPVMFEKRWLSSKTKFLFADAGIRLNFSLGADLDIYSIALSNTANGIYRVGGVNVYSNNDAQPWISFPINAGHAWVLKNNNLLQLAICSNISFTKYVNGRYHIDIPNQPLTEGNYSSTGSFVGLSFNYVFTNANYRIRKAYEKQDSK